MKNLISILILSFIFMTPIYSQNYFGSNCKNGSCNATTQNYTSCKNCVSNPGDMYCKTHSSSSTNYNSSTPSYSNPFNTTTKSKCGGTTQFGIACSRNAKEGSSYCSQHSPSNREQGLEPSGNICMGTTKSGRACRSKAKQGSMYCGHHGPY